MSKLMTVICYILSFTILFSGFHFNNENKQDKKNDAGFLLFETETITRNDYETKFSNYASEDATIEYTDSYLEKGPYGTKVVGVVRDYFTDELIPGAVVVVGGKEVLTDCRGRFQINGFPGGIYEWSVKAKGYEDSLYLNYEVDPDDVSVFTFYLNKNKPLVYDKAEIGKENDTTHSHDALDFSCAEDKFKDNTKSMGSFPNVDTNVIVKHNGIIKTVNRQVYIYTVLSGELYGVSYYTGKGLTNTQVNELYIAQATAANTFLEYAKKVYSNHPDCDVCSTTCCQVYDPTLVTLAAMTATTSIFYNAGGQYRTNIVMYKPTSTTYDYIYGAYFSSCGNQGTVTVSLQPALQAVSCTDLATGAGGHRKGMCQMGAAYLAKSGYTSGNILHYYYYNCCIAACALA